MRGKKQPTSTQRDARSRDAKWLTRYRRRQLHGQVRALLQQAKAASAEYHVQDHELRDQVVEHGQLACLQLCDKMHATLPGELRDMVYSNIIGPYHYEIVSKRSTWDNGVIRAKGITFVNTQLHKMSKPDAQPLQWWLGSYMGEEVAKEIIERWYRTRTFQFMSNKLHMLPVFLAIDAFEKSFEPGLLVQHIRIHIDATSSKVNGSCEKFAAAQLSTSKLSKSQPLN
jgi:hypothetical protein